MRAAFLCLNLPTHRKKRHDYAPPTFALGGPRQFCRRHSSLLGGTLYPHPRIRRIFSVGYVSGKRHRVLRHGAPVCPLLAVPDIRGGNPASAHGRAVWRIYHLLVVHPGKRPAPAIGAVPYPGALSARQPGGGHVALLPRLFAFKIPFIKGSQARLHNRPGVLFPAGSVEYRRPSRGESFLNYLLKHKKTSTGFFVAN